MGKAVSEKSKQPNQATPEDAETNAANELTSPAKSASPAPTEVATDSVVQEADPLAVLEGLQKQLEEARATADTHWDTVLRTRAELENLRKRSERDLENAHKFGVDRFIAEMLPVKDSLELGLAAAGSEDVSIEKVREGMQLTLKMFAMALDKLGVAEVNPEGEGFNPEFHQAMTVQEVEGQAAGTVIAVIQKGYLLNERLIRPALVVVAK